MELPEGSQVHRFNLQPGDRLIITIPAGVSYDGVSVLQEIRQAMPDVPVILIDGGAYPSGVVSADGKLVTESSDGQ